MSSVKIPLSPLSPASEQKDNQINANLLDYPLEDRRYCHPKHLNEWLESAVNPEIATLNIISLAEFEPYDYLLYALPDKERRNDGRIRDKWLRRYSHVEPGGWWCNGVDVLTGDESQWGQFKPDKPYKYQQAKGFAESHTSKIIKYEPPKNVPTEIFALKVTFNIWQAIASRYQIPMPENIVVSEQGEAIGFWTWVINHPQIPLLITEGAKKAGVLLTAHYVAIALPGIYNGYRQPKDEWGRKTGSATLIPQLQVFARHNREIIFCFDHDLKPKTVKNVRIAISKTGKLFAKEGCRVSAIVWNQPFKGVDDLIAALGVDCFQNLYKARLPFSKFHLLSLLDLSKYNPLKVNERYLSESLVAPEDVQIVGLRSPKGTGKTEWLSYQILKFIREGKPVLVITHRIQLAKALCSRFGIDHIEEVKNSETQGVLGYGLCIDSLHPHSQAHFHPEDWSEAVVILDECEQVIWHLLNSSTCGDNRVIIIENFKNLLNIAIATGGKIYLSDADLSCVAIDYVRKLIDLPVKIWVVDNLYSRSKKRFLYSYSGSDPRQLVAALVKAVEQGEKILIHTTGQKAKSKWGSINLESYLNQRFPKLKILRIDSESVSDPHHPAYGCMANLNSLLPLYDVVICSPVVETGVSIDIKEHFDSVWGIAQGIQTVDAVCQTLERLRDDVPRHIWIKTTAKGNRIGNGSVSIKGLLASQHKQTTANIRLLQQAGINDFDDFEVNYSPESLITWAKRACIVNTGKNNYREEVISKLLDNDYKLERVKDEEVDDSDIIKDQIKSTADENYRHYCHAIPKMNTPTDSELDQLNNKKAKTTEERYRERKGNLSKRYGIEVTPELVEKDDHGWYYQLQLHYYLTVGNAYLAQRDKRSLSLIDKQGQGKGFKPDINKKQLSAKVTALKLINIEQFLDLEAEFTKDSLAEWLELMVRFRHDLQAILGIAVNPDKDSAIAVAQRILKKLGLKLEFKYWRGDRKNKQRIYSGCQVDPERLKVFEFWLSKVVEQ